MARYFDQFPQFTYANSACIDILSRVGFNNQVKNLSIFYPYSMKEYDRADTISFDYYDDPDFDWLVYIPNDVVDPYYDVYLSTEDFASHIDAKYGSQTAAAKMTMYYRNDWIADDTILLPEAFDALDTSVKKFWMPLLSATGLVVGYQRKNVDWAAQTNEVLQITFTGNSAFTVGERINSSANGWATAVSSNTSVLVIQHNQGSFLANNSFTITGDASGVVGSVSNNSVVLLARPIPIIQQSYFAPVDAYTIETETNEQKKELKLMSKQFLGEVYKQFRKLMQK